MKVVVIGGGPAGMMSAITSAENGNDVILIEKMSSLGRKLLITGKGRCNITSSLNIDDFIKNIMILANDRELLNSLKKMSLKKAQQFSIDNYCVSLSSLLK